MDSPDPWAALAKLMGMIPWSRHGQKPARQASPISLFLKLVLCITLRGVGPDFARAKSTIAGPFCGVPLTNSKGLSSPDLIPSTLPDPLKNVACTVRLR